MINILVYNSTDSKRIADAFQKHFGPYVTCYMNVMPSNVKADLCVLSGMDVFVRGQSRIPSLKKNSGSKDVKVIVVSTMPEILQGIEKNGPKVDGLLLKEDLLKRLSIDKKRKNKNGKLSVADILKTLS